MGNEHSISRSRNTKVDLVRLAILKFWNRLKYGPTVMNLVNPSDPDKPLVYHYTSIDTAINKILADYTLQFNPFEKVNDPREYKDLLLNPVWSSNCNLSEEDRDRLAKDIAGSIKRNSKLICFSADRHVPFELHVKYPYLAKGWAKPSMWHHYASKHNGVCLMFDAIELHTAFALSLPTKKLIHGPVEYADEGGLAQALLHPYSVDFTDIVNYVNVEQKVQAHLSRWIHPIFFRKLNDWSNETEHRWVCFDDNPYPVLVGFGNSLKGIVIGEQVADEQREELLRICKARGLECATLSWTNGYPGISLKTWGKRSY